jgi:hypothetical protein
MSRKRVEKAIKDTQEKSDNLRTEVSWFQSTKIWCWRWDRSYKSSHKASNKYKALKLKLQHKRVSTKTGASGVALRGVRYPKSFRGLEQPKMSNSYQLQHLLRCTAVEISMTSMCSAAHINGKLVWCFCKYILCLLLGAESSLPSSVHSLRVPHPFLWSTLSNRSTPVTHTQFHI